MQLAHSAVTSSRRIVVVDDDPDVCETIGSIITAGTPHQVERFTDPVAALDRIRREPCHLVVTDILMPRLDGIALAREIKSARPEVEIIVLTGHASVDVAVGALRHRAHDFIQKPFTAMQVLDSLARALARQESNLGFAQAVERSAAVNADLKRRGRHQCSRLSVLERAGTARLAYRMLARRMKGRADDLTAGLTALADPGGRPNDPRVPPERLEPLKRAINGLKADLTELIRGPAVGALQFRRQDVCQLVSARCQDFLDYFPEVRLGLTTPPVAVHLDLDADAFGVALTHVLLNAVEAGGTRGQILVDMSVSATGVEIVVTDGGPGFTPIALARATQLFYSTKGPPWPGVGLALARQIAEEHGGSISIENAPGSGGRVILRMPRWRP